MLDAEKKWLKAGLTVWVKTTLLHRVDRTAPTQPKEEEPVASDPKKEKAPSDTGAAKTAKGNPKVKLTTSHGGMVLELYPDKAPKTVENFLSYVRKSHYDGTIFHRVIPNFMIQGGGFTPDYAQKPSDPPIPIESSNGLRNTRGTVAMARTNDPNSATAQFFVNVVDNGFLDFKSAGEPGYTVFGRVVEGLETADKIRNLPTGAAGPFGSDVPKETVLIQKAEILP
ncbi:peptidyl-prolyl cis-trans isomerase [bacterium]|nr:peptidyl-prolyl cis-trans isomerase [bacterium]